MNWFTKLPRGWQILSLSVAAWIVLLMLLGVFGNILGTLIGVAIAGALYYRVCWTN